MQKLIKNISLIWNKFKKTDDYFWEEIEEQLILGDVSIETAQEIINNVKKYSLAENISDLEVIKDFLKKQIIFILSDNASKSITFSNLPPNVWLIVGVNGVGKTSTIAKLANYFKKQGKSIILTAADTYRAAAYEQINHFAEVLNIPVVHHQQFSDPGAVVYDSIEKAAVKQIDLILIDTAGRMHTSYNLMEELKKIKRVIFKKLNREPDEILMILDSTTGQNARIQVSSFHESLNLSGIILTKTDGTSKGGMILTIKNEFKIPIKFITDGEGLDDIEAFNPEKFTRMLFE
ncbi:MAG: signal recognition particle-docking protein FtsY [Actinobacteria bacterium]|nr:signal recognition particle-docking protein FtsY [Actinomycetota bacterium]